MSATQVPILLVDDHPSNLVALQAILEKPEYSVVTANSGKEALKLLLQREFALVLLDVMMPDMDGFAVASAMKSVARTRYIPIIFVTAIAKSVKEVYRGYSVGGVDYIQKPLDPDVVRAKVAIFVEIFRQRKEIERQAEIIRESERAQSFEREKAARVRAEEAEARYYALINWVDHAVLWEYDVRERKFSFVGRRSGEIFGLSSELWMSDRGYFLNRVHPDDRRVFDEMIESGTKGVDGRCEVRIFGGDGATHWIHSGVNPRKDASGRVNLLWGLTLDITGFKAIEKRQSLLVQANTLLNASLDFPENIEKVSQLLVKSLADWCLMDLLVPAGPPKRLTVAHRLQNEDWVRRFQTYYPLRRGHHSPILKSIENGEPVLLNVVTEDHLKSMAEDEEHLRILKEVPMTSLMVLPLRARKAVLGAMALVSSDPHRRFGDEDVKFGQDLAWHIAAALDNAQMYGETKRAVAVREEVLRIVSHDLRGPLSAIQLNAQLLSRDGSEPELRGKRIARSVDEMSRLITDLLDLGKVESGVLKIEKKAYSVHQLVDEVIDSVTSIAEAKKISLKRECSESFPLLVDHDRLFQALSNVLGNAVKFTPANGVITVGCRIGDRNEALFWVSDTGPGIRPEDLPHVFERFWQSKDGERQKGSAGLGLTIAKSMVEAHRGKIWVESKLGAGTTFFVSLPRSEVGRRTEGAA